MCRIIYQNFLKNIFKSILHNLNVVVDQDLVYGVSRIIKCAKNIITAMYVVCRCIIELHGGHIGVASPGPGLGSTFSFTLPAQHKPNYDDKTYQRATNKDANSCEQRVIPFVAANLLNIRSEPTYLDKTVTLLDEIIGGNMETEDILRGSDEKSTEKLLKLSKLPSYKYKMTHMESPFLDHLTVLIIDDSVIVRKLITKQLHVLHADCVQACDGIKGVEMVKEILERQDKLDVVLIDFHMPGGLEGPET